MFGFGLDLDDRTWLTGPGWPSRSVSELSLFRFVLFHFFLSINNMLQFFLCRAVFFQICLCQLCPVPLFLFGVILRPVSPFSDLPLFMLYFKTVLFVQLSFFISVSLCFLLFRYIVSRYFFFGMFLFVPELSFPWLPLLFFHNCTFYVSSYPDVSLFRFVLCPFSDVPCPDLSMFGLFLFRTSSFSELTIFQMFPFEKCMLLFLFLLLHHPFQTCPFQNCPC